MCVCMCVFKRDISISPPYDVWIFFTDEYCSGVNIFQGWTFFNSNLEFAQITLVLFCIFFCQFVLSFGDLSQVLTEIVADKRFLSSFNKERKERSSFTISRFEKILWERRIKRFENSLSLKNYENMLLLIFKALSNGHHSTHCNKWISFTCDPI